MPNTGQFKIRDVTISDSASILAIYKPYIQNTAITFEEKIPTIEDFDHRITAIIKTYPYICATQNNQIVGYAYASALKARDAFARSVELSIYLNPLLKHQGLGSRLYNELFTRLQAQGIVSVYAAIASCDTTTPYLDKTSIYFHEKLGFKTTGIFPNCACKFNTWFNLVWMYKDLVDRTTTTPQSSLFKPRT